MTEFVWLIVITDCSGCFRLERLLGGASAHWKAPPLHGAADIDWAIWSLPLSPPSKSLRWPRVALGTSVGAIEAISDLEE